MTPLEFAITVVKKLQEAGFQALFAGGCVRDSLLKVKPKDYDVATNARPQQIEELFGKKRTLAIGAAFGVITVLGPKSAGPIEVATFRRDGDYSDGRRPDDVEFTDAREDALRRDFTINGMFFDPVNETVLDYVGGQEDLKKQQIRAIGNPHERIDEDKLRMLRGVRFAATYDFQLEPETLAAIQQHAPEIEAVSEERVGAELVRMLSHRNKACAAQLLLDSGLLKEVLPKGWANPASFEDENWQQRIVELNRLSADEFSAAIAIFLREYLEVEQGDLKKKCQQLQLAWKLNNQYRDQIAWITQHRKTLQTADSKKWSELQPVLIQPAAALALDVSNAVEGDTRGEAFCRARLEWPTEQLDPKPLISGQDLIANGIQPGPQFKQVLQQVRDQQLDGELESKEEAMEFVKTIL